MTQDRPTAVELLEAVREFLERDVLSEAHGRVRFHTRVAINALGIVERELTDAAALEAAERERAIALLADRASTEELGDDLDTATARDLEAVIARRIRDGSLDDRRDAVVAHVRATVREKLRVANPDYVVAHGDPGT